MKRFVFFLSILDSLNNLNAQDCTPDQSITSPGFHPKTIEPAYVETDYKQVLQIRVFADTTVVMNGNPIYATIDSIKVKEILGLPSGFYYTCSRKGCSFIPDSTGCATMQGNAKKGQGGFYPIGVSIRVYAKAFGSISQTLDDTVNQFTLEVMDESGIAGFKNAPFSIYPNPSNGLININKLVGEQIKAVDCFDNFGKKVNYEVVNNQITILNNTPGLYHLRVEFTNGEVGTQKILIQ